MRVSSLSRRRVLLGALACVSYFPRMIRADDALPKKVSGIRFPDSDIARKAWRLSLGACPPYLFNHCMRTYLFGAIAMEHHGLHYDADAAFVAAALHDLGLLPQHETKIGSFETDGADEAARIVRESGLPVKEAEIVWHAIALHDNRFTFAEHQGPEAMLVAMGAASDVLGPDAEMIGAQRTEEVLAAFPRFDFKKRFIGLAREHCRRKPLSQQGTWLEGLCREQTPQAFSATLEQAIASAPFTE